MTVLNRTDFVGRDSVREVGTTRLFESGRIGNQVDGKT